MKASHLIRSSVAALAAIGFLAGSPALFAKDATPAPTIKLAQLPMVKSGMSTAEVEHALGTPARKPVWLNGTMTWVYDTEDWTQSFDVDFGTDGKVSRAMLYQRASSGNT